MRIDASSPTSPADTAAAPLSRREVLAGAVATAGLAALALLPSESLAPPAAVITDPRLTQSAGFLRGIGASPLRVEISGDGLQTWRTLRKALAGGAPVAGLVRWIDFLLLEGCAREDGFVCAHRGGHQPQDGGTVIHTGTDERLRGALARAAGDWPQALGAHLSAGRRLRASPGGSSGRSSGSGSGHIHLVSFLLAAR